MFVRNNAEATLNVGDKVPINTTTVNTGIGTGTYSSVQYIDTGVILKVRPRVTRDGTVFLDIVQEVSSASNVPDNCNPTERNCNPRISTKKLSTEAAVQSGDTIMLAGLITDSATDGSSGIPGLSRIPVVGALFGQKSRTSRRSEVIVLLTPSIVRNGQEARNLTDEYSQRFRAMEPLNQPRAKKGFTAGLRPAPAEAGAGATATATATAGLLRMAGRCGLAGHAVKQAGPAASGWAGPRKGTCSVPATGPTPPTPGTQLLLRLLLLPWPEAGAGCNPADTLPVLGCG